MTSAGQDPRPSSAPHAKALKLKAKSKAQPARSRNSGAARGDPESNYTEYQEYGSPVSARLQRRLQDPAWLLEHAEVCDKRKQFYNNAVAEGSVWTATEHGKIKQAIERGKSKQYSNSMVKAVSDLLSANPANKPSR